LPHLGRNLQYGTTQVGWDQKGGRKTHRSETEKKAFPPNLKKQSLQEKRRKKRVSTHKKRKKKKETITVMGGKARQELVLTLPSENEGNRT